MDRLGCDDETSRRRVQDAKELPAAIWQVRPNQSGISNHHNLTFLVWLLQIFRPEDGDVVRDLINGASAGTDSPSNFDPVEAETAWVDQADMAKMKYGVRPTVIAQFPGEALLLPAGSPRQVKSTCSARNTNASFIIL